MYDQDDVELDTMLFTDNMVKMAKLETIQAIQDRITKLESLRPRVLSQIERAEDRNDQWAISYYHGKLDDLNDRIRICIESLPSIPC